MDFLTESPFNLTKSQAHYNILYLIEMHTGPPTNLPSTRIVKGPGPWSNQGGAIKSIHPVGRLLGPGKKHNVLTFVVHALSPQCLQM